MFGSKDTTREAFKAGLIESGQVWMAMIESRNQTTHTYDEATMAIIVTAILQQYFAEFEKFRMQFNSLKEKAEE